MTAIESIRLDFLYCGVRAELNRLQLSALLECTGRNEFQVPAKLHIFKVRTSEEGVLTQRGQRIRKRNGIHFRPEWSGHLPGRYRLSVRWERSQRIHGNELRVHGGR